MRLILVIIVHAILRLSFVKGALFTGRKTMKSIYNLYNTKYYASKALMIKGAIRINFFIVNEYYQVLL